MCVCVCVRTYISACTGGGNVYPQLKGRVTNGWFTVAHQLCHCYRTWAFFSQAALAIAIANSIIKIPWPAYTYIAKLYIGVNKIVCW